MPGSCLFWLVAASTALCVDVLLGRQFVPNASVTECVLSLYRHWQRPVARFDRLVSKTDNPQRYMMCLLKQVPLKLSIGSHDALSHYSTCAVVSSSGALKVRNASEDIDSHEAVFRINHAPTLGYEHLVGSKETVRVTDSKGFNLTNRTVKPDVKYIWTSDWPDWESDRLLIKPNHYVKLHDDFLAGLQGFFFDVDGGTGRERPTAGALTLVTALSLCDRITAFDLAFSEQSARAPTYYFGKAEGRATENTWHTGWLDEHKLWRVLSDTPPSVVDATGRTVYRGFSQWACSETGDSPGSAVLIP